MGDAIRILLTAATGVLLTSCDGEYARIARRAALEEKFFNACLPEFSQTVQVRWVDGKLICNPLGKKRQPAIVASVEEIQ